MTGWVIGGAMVTAVLVLICLFISANALARRARVIFTVGAVFGIVLLAAVPSVMVITSERSERPEASPLSIQMGMGVSGGAGDGSSKAPTPTATNNEDTKQEEISMDNKQKYDIQRAIGRLEGVIISLAPDVREMMEDALELLEDALEPVLEGELDGGEPEAAGGELPAVQRQKEWDASRYLPVETGWYQGYIEGTGYSESVYYKAETQVWTNVAGDKVNVERWSE